MQLLLIILVIAGFLVAGLFDNTVRDDMVFQWPVYLTVSVAGVAVLGMLRRRPRFLPNHLCLLVALIAFGYIFWRAFFATPTLYLGRQDWTLALATFTIYILLAAVLVKVRQRMWLIYLLAILSAFNSFVAIYEYFNADFSFHILPGFLQPEYLGRASGLFANPNHLAAFLNATILMLLSVVLFGRPAPYTKLLFTLVSVLSVVALALTKSRAGVISFGIGVVLLLLIYLLLGRKFYRYYFRNKAIAICVSVVFALGGLAWVAVNEVGTRFETVDQSDFRSGHRQMAVDLWHESPIIGSGARSFQFRSLKYRETHEKWTLHLMARHTHSEYYQLLAEYGLLGFALVMGFIVIHFLNGLKFVRWFSGTKFEKVQQARSDTLGTCLGAALGLACLLIHAFWEFHFHVSTTCFVGAFFFAILSNPGFEKIDYKHSRIPGVLPGAKIVIVLGGLLILWKGPAYFWSERTASLARAESSELGYDERLAMLEEVVETDPDNFVALKVLGRLHELRADDPTEEEPLKYHLAAFESYYQAFRINPWDIYAAVRTAYQLGHLRRFDEALVLLERARSIAPYHWVPHYQLGLHYARLGNYKEAAKHLAESSKFLRVKHEPKNLKEARKFVRDRIREEKKLKRITNP